MSRSFSTDVAAALAQSHVRLITMVKLEFDSATLYVHNGLGTYSWDGQSWLGAGDLASISAISEGNDLTPYAVKLSLSSIDASVASAALEENYFQRPVTIYLGVLDENDAFVQESSGTTNNPVQVWAGFIDSIAVTSGNEGGDAVVVTCESELAIFQRSRNLLFTNVWQQDRSAHNNDRFFDLVHKMDGMKVNWRGNKKVMGSVDANTPVGPKRQR
jgi:hypothetical protein